MQEKIEHIIEGCIAGERASQYKLYTMLASKLRLVCRRYTGSKDIAEDCLQDAFIKIFTNIKDFRGDCEFAGWARRITVNTLISNLKKDKLMFMESMDSENDHIAIPADTDPSSGLSMEYLLKTIDMLPGDRRIVFNLHAIEGYEHKEIGEMLGITEVNSRNILFMARKTLFSILQKNKSGYEQNTAR